jgi:hypothetical protein
MEKVLGAFIGLGIVMVIGFLLIILEKGNGLLQFIGIIVMFGAVFTAPVVDLKLRQE